MSHGGTRFQNLGHLFCLFSFMESLLFEQQKLLRVDFISVSLDFGFDTIGQNLGHLQKLVLLYLYGIIGI